MEEHTIYTSKIARLIAYDSALITFGVNGYARNAQPRARQPIVQTEDEFDAMLIRMYKKIFLPQNATKQEQDLADDTSSALANIKSVLNYRGNTYSGCTTFCQNCEEILGPIGTIHHKQLGHSIFEQDPDKPHPGFVQNRTPNGLGMPCLFNRMGIAFQRNIQDTGAVSQTLQEREKLIPGVCWIKYRSRLSEICMALHTLALSAFELLMIVDDSIEGFQLIPMHTKWDAIIKIKHYHEE